jgi:hypothetical protein
VSERTRKSPAMGTRTGAGSRQKFRNMRRIVVGFDDETFEQVRSLALAAGHGFGAQVRELVEFGLMDVAQGGEGNG